MDQVNTQATFYLNDKFGRKQYMDMCTKLIENHPNERGACTIAVDAPWGVGKSTFLWMWINELTQKNSYLEFEDCTKEEATKKYVFPIYYNAWECDFCDSALAPLLYSICAIVDKESKSHDFLPKDLSFLKTVISKGVGVLAMFGAKIYGLDDGWAQGAGVVGELSARGILSLFERYSEYNTEEIPETDSIGAVYDKQLEEREAFREALSDLVKQFGGVYIFIDELDRCKPSFAIDTLDVIKHYFNIPGLTFVFGVDMLQLGHAISGRYGNNYDAEGYLSKFFEHHILLPNPTAEQMIRYCDPKSSLSHISYKQLDDIFRACRVSPREIPRIFKASNTLLVHLRGQLSGCGSDNARNVVFMLTSMRYRLTSVYNSYINGETDWNTQHWDEKHSFWDYLAYFFPYISKTAGECMEEWRDILRHRNDDNNVADEWKKDMARLSRAIYDSVHLYDSDTFGYCLSRFMEQVYI